MPALLKVPPQQKLARLSPRPVLGLCKARAHAHSHAQFPLDRLRNDDGRQLAVGPRENDDAVPLLAEAVLSRHLGPYKEEGHYAPAVGVVGTALMPDIWDHHTNSRIHVSRQRLEPLVRLVHQGHTKGPVREQPPCPCPQETHMGLALVAAKVLQGPERVGRVCLNVTAPCEHEGVERLLPATQEQLSVRFVKLQHARALLVLTTPIRNETQCQDVGSPANEIKVMHLPRRARRVAER
mmetsp:Transcript_32799/g.76391  ORF Transcript_32799/g.76391 Transcript_32799/m.76391 type:complete len:238 (-) Transcript_32799:1489-2202(-)